MTKQELVDVLNIVQRALETNKKWVTPKLLDSIERLIHDYAYSPNIRAVIMGTFAIDNDTIDDILEVIQEVIDTERKLVETPLTNKLIQGIKNLKSRGAILSLLAALI